MRYDLWSKQREEAKVTRYGLRVHCEERPEWKYQRYCLKVRKPKAKNPCANYSFKSIERRAEYIKRIVENQKRKEQYKKDRKEARKVKPEVSKSVKRGDIYVTSWGYDQTNYDYIAVLEVSKTGKTAKCQRTSSIHLGESGVSNVQEPVFCPFGDVFTMRIENGYDGEAGLRGSYPFCYDGTGSKRLDSFHKHKVGREYHETMSQFGH